MANFRRWRRVAAVDSQFAIRNSQFERGVALIITLILLAITLVMAVAFLAVARRERNAVATTADAAAARLAADSALSAAQAQIMANLFTSGAGAYNYHLLVSTNFINGNGFDSLVGANLANVNFDYYDDANHTPLNNVNDFLQNVANLQILPRVPVYVFTNNNGPLDFRFYLDLNRNAMFDTNGWVQDWEYYGGILNTNPNGPIVQTGDPEWIGVLAHPEQPHGPNNPFVARYAFFAQPIGEGLDLNYIHNQTYNSNPNLNLSVPDGYFRNEGVGSWELNLASFLADLNTNQWGQDVGATTLYYQYNEPYNFNQGAAFDDARALLAWRYDGNYNNLGVPMTPLYNALVNAGIDGYSIGSLMTNTFLPVNFLPRNQHWAGSDNPNRFFAVPSDLFDNSKTTVGVPLANVSSGKYLSGRLSAAGAGVTTYDRYTFYRLLDQLGTESVADDVRLNLNYSNAIVTYNANGIVTDVHVVPGAETNAIPWQPLDFFNAAADRMLHYYTEKWYYNTNTYYDFTNSFLVNGPFGITNIPVYINGRFVYSPAVNRLLQLAANLYDASTNTYYPHVFRPMFVYSNSTDVYISGFREITGTLTPGTAPLDRPLDVTGSGITPNAAWNAGNGNVFGVPWIVGAKKGFPAFNELAMRSSVQVTRKLALWRTYGDQGGGTAANPSATNQMLTISITNHLGISFWNSYNNNSTSSYSIYFNDIARMTLTNEYGVTTNLAITYSDTNYPTIWPGSHWTTYNGQDSPYLQTPDPVSFMSAQFDFVLVPELDFSITANQFIPKGVTGWDFTYPTPGLPHFGLNTTNWMQAFILDNGRVIDYVQLKGPETARNLYDEVHDNWGSPSIPTYNSYDNKGLLMWQTNLVGGSLPTRGVRNQITISRFNTSGNNKDYWKVPAGMPSGFPNSREAESAFFNGFFTVDYNFGGQSYKNTNQIVQAPYTPTVTVWDYTLWQVNDPLVHHFAGDLTTTTSITGTNKNDGIMIKTEFPPINLTSINDRYQPWGRDVQMGEVHNVDHDSYNFSYRDSLVWGSDYWNFPAGSYPNIGWIGRVHRGTPWQTINLKATNVLTIPSVGVNTWAQWSGDTRTSNGRYFDAINSAPVRDSDLFDLFTVRFNDNAVHGALSVNQTHLAAWSALFGGVVALTNITDTPASHIMPVISNTIIQPAGVLGSGSALAQLVNSITDTRNNFVNADGVKGTFEHVGDILRTPALSEQSPFLNWSDSDHRNFDLTDTAYEWLPQQVMGLLRAGSTPRYVVYCYGQALRPAPNSLVTSSSILPSGLNPFGMCTNYQVVAESAARAVIRVDRHVITNNVVAPPFFAGTNYTITVESFNPLKPD